MSHVVVLLGSRLGAVLPATALPALREASAVYAGTDVPPHVRASLGAEQISSTEQVLSGPPAAVIAVEATEPTAAALAAAGARVITVEEPSGAALLEAVSVMDRLRSPGGCPWDAKQTHDSLRQYLVEESYELLDAIEQGDRAALREELGDVLLQVLFHARVAAEDPSTPFDIDAVAGGLVDKLVGRHPHVFGDEELAEGSDPHDRRWDELKQAEKRRESSVDGVALGQPAVALAGKLAHRASKAGLPVELLPDGDGAGVTLFLVAALARLAGEDPEGELRAVAKQFEADVRAAEQAAKLSGLDQNRLTAEDWRRYWPKNP